MSDSTQINALFQEPTDHTSDGFDIEDFRGAAIARVRTSRLEQQYSRIRRSGNEIDKIATAVEKAVANITERPFDSFVIYGEPQSGKTEMMIALTAALLDAGRRVIIILTNDSVQLIDQNLNRFKKSGLDPAPKSFDEILDPAVILGDREWIVFCKKNQADLTKLIDKIKKVPNRLVIDDEADYASPNSKVNTDQRTRINELVSDLIGRDGAYIGVTATPARLDLNATFENANNRWVDFPPHSAYTGQEDFFPVTDLELQNLKFGLVFMPGHHDDEIYLRRALLSFLSNAAFLNFTNIRASNYSMLIHTSGKKADHTVDFQIVTKVLNVLSDENHKMYERYVRELKGVATVLFPEVAQAVTRHVLATISQNSVTIMNSGSGRKQPNYDAVTTPAALYTVAIGGNIVSRGVTFNDLLCMFFTRDTRHRIQQDTYIQRARMFGSRGEYLQWFQLFIPDDLYWNWQRCFVFHQLSLRAMRDGTGMPLWIEDNRIKAAATASVKTSVVQWQAGGEMYWDLFDYSEAVRRAVDESRSGMAAVRTLVSALTDEDLPKHIVEFIRDFSPHGNDSVVVHAAYEIGDSYRTADAATITRDKGLMGTPQLERDKFPKAIHHLKVFTNANNKARVYYKYAPSPSDAVVNSKNLAFGSRQLFSPTL